MWLIRLFQWRRATRVRQNEDVVQSTPATVTPTGISAELENTTTTTITAEEGEWVVPAFLNQDCLTSFTPESPTDASDEAPDTAIATENDNDNDNESDIGYIVGPVPVSLSNGIGTNVAEDDMPDMPICSRPATVLPQPYSALGLELGDPAYSHSEMEDSAPGLGLQDKSATVQAVDVDHSYFFSNNDDDHDHGSPESDHGPQFQVLSPLGTDANGLTFFYPPPHNRPFPSDYVQHPRPIRSKGVTNIPLILRSWTDQLIQNELILNKVYKEVQRRQESEKEWERLQHRDHEQPEDGNDFETSSIEAYEDRRDIRFAHASSSSIYRCPSLVGSASPPPSTAARTPAKSFGSSANQSLRTPDILVAVPRFSRTRVPALAPDSPKGADESDQDWVDICLLLDEEREAQRAAVDEEWSLAGAGWLIVETSTERQGPAPGSPTGTDVHEDDDWPDICRRMNEERQAQQAADAEGYLSAAEWTTIEGSIDTVRSWLDRLPMPQHLADPFTT
ncbi:hypothetical protein IAT40_003843 [Kwoniella sp. CBS 6097]